MAELNAIVVHDGVARLAIDAEPYKHKVVGEIIAGGHDSSLALPFWATFKSKTNAEISLFFNDDKTHDFLLNAYMSNDEIELWQN